MTDEIFGLGPWIGLAILVVIGLPVLRRLMLLHAILGERLAARPLVRDDARPEHEVAYLEAGLAPFTALGFEAPQLRAQALPSADRARGALVAQRGPVVLVLARTPAADRAGAHAVQLVSFPASGVGVVTLPGLAPLLPAPLAGVETVAPESHAPQDVLQAHLDAMARRAGPWLEDRDAILARFEAAEVEMQARLRRAGDSEPDPDRPGVDRLTLAGAWRWTSRMLSAPKPTGEEPTLPPEIVADLLADQAALRAAPRRRDFTLGLLAITASLFAGGIALIWSVAAALTLTATVFLHELGHLVAMRAVGAKNTSVFFIPFLGAATTGQRRVGTLAEETWILLAGPVPGIALAGAIGWLRPERLDTETGLLVFLSLLFLNAFNLLPFFPLDGGKVVHAVLFARRPYGDAIARLVASALLAIAGAFVGDPILVGVGALGLFGIRGAFELARLEAELRADGVDADTPEHARARPRSCGRCRPATLASPSSSRAPAPSRRASPRRCGASALAPAAASRTGPPSPSRWSPPPRSPGRRSGAPAWRRRRTWCTRRRSRAPGRHRPRPRS